MPRKCKSCGEKFVPSFNTLQSTCGELECALAHGKNLQAKAKKADDKAFKQKVRNNDRSWHIKTLQTEFNKFIRLRDQGNVCISCGTIPKKKNAGHYRSTGAAPELRFVEANCHLQCEHCNSFKSGNIEKYRINLIRKIGIAAVEALEGFHAPVKYIIPELQDKITHYRKLNKELPV